MTITSDAKPVSRYPHIRFANSSRRGYTTLELTAKRCVARLRAVNEKSNDSPVDTFAAWTVEDGRPGAQRGS